MHFPTDRTDIVFEAAEITALLLSDILTRLRFFLTVPDYMIMELCGGGLAKWRRPGPDCA